MGMLSSLWKTLTSKITGGELKVLSKDKETNISFNADICPSASAQMELFLCTLFILTDVKTIEEDKTVKQNDFVLHKHSPEPCPLAVYTLLLHC